MALDWIVSRQDKVQVAHDVLFNNRERASVAREEEHTVVLSLTFLSIV